MKSAFIAASLLMLTTAAYAADPVIEDDPIVEATPVFSWSGAYVGLQAGYAWGDSTADYFDLTPPGFTAIDPDGWLLGAYAGYNHQLSNNIVLGIDADIAYANVDGTETYIAAGVPMAGETDSAQLNWSAAIRGRVGYAMGRFLPYIAGGVAFGDYDTQAASATPAIVGSWNETYTGYTVGAGADYALTDMVILRGEYRFTDFGSENFAPVDPTGLHSVDLQTHDIRFGVAVKF